MSTRIEQEYGIPETDDGFLYDVLCVSLKDNKEDDIVQGGFAYKV